MDDISRKRVRIKRSTMKKFLAEFKEFAIRGNVIDMAIGVVIGGAFGKITSSLVNNIIMPLIGMITGGIDLAGWDIVLKPGVEGVSEPVVLGIGTLLATIIDFVIIALTIFVVVKALNALRKKKTPEPEPEPAPPAGPTTEELLAEIRDLLKERK